MPRSVSGNYTLPLPPVVPNTTIEAAWANTTDDDMAQALTDSLDRYGRGGMVAPFRLVDGAEAIPAWAFAAETGTGMYRESAGVLSVSIQGANVGQWSAAGYSGNLAGPLDISGVISFTDDVFFNAPVVFEDIALFEEPVTFNDFITVAGASLQLGFGIDATAVQLEMGNGRTADGNAYIDMVSASGGPDFNTRLIRNAGTNGGTSLLHRGTGNLTIMAENAAPVVLGSNNSQWFVITSDGRVYGAALHNNSGSVSGTTNQYLASGTYVPASLPITNVASAVGNSGRWMRVGNVVTVSMSCIVTTSAAGFSQVLVPLPLNGTNLGAYVAGAAVLNPPGSIFAGTVVPNAAGALIAFVAPGALVHDMNVTVTYVIL